MKIVINGCYGGFSLSREAVLRARELSGNPNWGGACIAGDVYDDGNKCTRDYGYVEVARNDTYLVAAVEELGRVANGSCADLRVIEIPENVNYTIEEYDGVEWVAEVHRTWR